MTFSLAGRLMQGSASTAMEAIIYEISGTFAELYAADEL